MSFDTEANAEHLERELRAAATEAQNALEALQAAKDALSQWRGRNADPRLRSDLLDNERHAGRRHQRALGRVSDLKRRIKDVEIGLRRQREEANRKEMASRRLGFAEHFMNTARELLDPDVFAGLMQEATLRKNRELVPVTPNTATGAAIGVQGGASGFRQRKTS